MTSLKLLFPNFLLKFWHRHYNQRQQFPKITIILKFDDSFWCVFYRTGWKSSVFLFQLIWPNELEYVSHVALGTGIIFVKFELGRVILSRVFTADTLCHIVTLIFDPLTLNVWSVPDITWSNSVRVTLSQVRHVVDKQCNPWPTYPVADLYER